MKTKLLKSTFILLSIVIASTSYAQVQEVIYHETFGVPTGNINVNTYTGYDNPGVVYECINNNSDVRTTHSSSTSYYPLASGGGNVMINNATKTLYVSGISIQGYTDLAFAFGLRKGSTASTGSELELRFVIDEDTSAIVPITLPTGPGTAIYHWVEIPSTYLTTGDSLTILFEGTSNVEFRIDDLYLTGVEEESLPITLTHFDVKADREYLFFEWKTSMEYDLSHYEIEQSLNGKDFTCFTKKNALNHAWGASYALRILNKNSENDIRYFRLKSVDLDGAYSYSNVVPLFDVQEKTMSAIPNYFSKNETLRLGANWEGAKLMLYDLNGRMVRHHNYLTVGEGVKFDDLLANQMYILVLKDRDGRQYSKKMMLLP